MIEKLNTSAEQKIVGGGDFNVTIDPDLDCSGGNPTKKDSVKHIQDIPYLLVYKSNPHFQGQKSSFSSFWGKTSRIHTIEISQNVNLFFLRTH